MVQQQQRFGKIQGITGQKRPAAATVAPRPQKQRPQEDTSGHQFEQQLRDLWRMGFTDRSANIRALAMSGGDVVEAIQIMLPEGEDETSSASEEGTRDKVRDGDLSLLQPRHPSRVGNKQVRQEARMLQQHQFQGQVDRSKNLDVQYDHRAQQLPLPVAQGEPNLGNAPPTSFIVDLTRENEDNISSLPKLEERAAQIEASCRLLAYNLSSTSDCKPHLIRKCRALEEELQLVRERISMLKWQRRSASDTNDDAQHEEVVSLYLDALKKRL